MKYVDTKVVFREVPDQITLAVNISQCPVQCPGCHSSYLAQDIGEILDEDVLDALIKANTGISCVSFMGGDRDPMEVRRLAEWLHCCYPKLKVCWYSGRNLEMARNVIPVLDFIKVGPYVDEFGPLNSKTTNQRFYSITHKKEGPTLTDWTFKFQQ